MPNLSEAATIRARARGLVNAAKALLADKTLPGNLRRQIEGLSKSLAKTWKDLEADAAADASESLRESQAMLTCLITCRGCLSACQNCMRVCQACPNSLSGAHVDCMAACQAAGDSCQAMQSAADANGLDSAECMAACQACLDDCAACAQSCLACLLECDHCAWACEMCVSGCASCARDCADCLGGAADGDSDAPAQAMPMMNAKREAAVVLDLGGDVVPLLETAVRKDGTMAIRAISPGWGSSGYYSAEVLQRDGPKVFTKGTKIFVDHPTPTEERERPERSVRDLAAVLTTDARWESDHPSGPGLYAEAQVKDSYRPMVNELAPDIGLSIRAKGKAATGTIEGRTGPIISEISAAQSVDLVTLPGRGGAIISLFEARRETAHAIVSAPLTGPSSTTEVTMDEQEIKKLQEANTQLAAQLQAQAATVAGLKHDALLREAREIAALELAKAQLPPQARVRLLSALAANPPEKDGALDHAALATRITEAVQAETAYLAEVVGAGRITGLGGTTQVDNPEASRKALKEAFARMGLDERQASLAADGR